MKLKKQTKACSINTKEFLARLHHRRIRCQILDRNHKSTTPAPATASISLMLSSSIIKLLFSIKVMCKCTELDYGIKAIMTTGHGLGFTSFFELKFILLGWAMKGLDGANCFSY